MFVFKNQWRNYKKLSKNRPKTYLNFVKYKKYSHFNKKCHSF